MAYLLVGGEDSEFFPTGNAAVDEGTTARRRAAYSRCSLRAAYTVDRGDYWYAPFMGSSNFWVSAYLSIESGFPMGGGSGDLIGVLNGAVRRLAISCRGAVNTGRWTLQKINAAGTATTLFTAAADALGAGGTSTRLDLFVNYGSSGQVQLYSNGVKVIDYSGDVTTDSATTLDGVAFGCLAPQFNNNYGFYWSEIAVATHDTRSISGIVTLAPSGAGSSTAWAGAYTDIDEATKTADSIVSDTPNQVEQFAITPVGTITSGSHSVSALVVSALAHRGSVGPQNMQLSVRTASADYFSATVSMSVANATRQSVWTTNPNTSAAWTAADLIAAGFNIGIKSVA